MEMELEQLGCTRADFSQEQLDLIDGMKSLFPRGYIFYTPASRDRSPVPEELDHHILFTDCNLSRMWGALYDFFEVKLKES